MNLLDLVHRTKSPEPWVEGEKILWDDAGPSERMLREHLSQDHDAASRRFAKIDAHGEPNTFRPSEARAILRKARDALSEGGLLLLEPSTFEAIRQSAQSGTRWYTTPNSLFSPQPHLCLEEHFWDQARHTQTTRYYIVDATAGQVTRYASSSTAYTDEDIRELLTGCGFTEVKFFASLVGAVEQARGELCVVAARKQGLS